MILCHNDLWHIDPLVISILSCSRWQVGWGQLLSALLCCTWPGPGRGRSCGLGPGTEQQQSVRLSEASWEHSRHHHWSLHRALCGHKRKSWTLGEYNNHDVTSAMRIQWSVLHYYKGVVSGILTRSGAGGETQPKPSKCGATQGSYK